MKPDAVTPVLCDPSIMLTLDLPGWDSLLRQARHANLLARIARDVELLGALEQIPEKPRAHLVSALTLAARQRITVRAEVRRVAQALAEEGLPLILLKGAAYAMANLPCADGRLFGDIDLLVPHDALSKAESVFMRHGWASAHHSAYDQQYYRRWMHELPPLEHLNRHSILDVHHNILPATAKHPPDAKLLLDAAQPVANEFGLDIRTLAPADMVLHSACHLFHEGELDNGLRDLADLDRLLRHFTSSENFWSTLVARAHALHLTRPLYYALHLSAAILHTPIPADAVAAIADAAPVGLRGKLMDALYLRALRPAHHLADDHFTPLARWLLYIRGHWLRMPPYLLAWHLGRKSVRRALGLEDGDEDENAHPTQGQGGH